MVKHKKKITVCAMAAVPVIIFAVYSLIFYIQVINTDISFDTLTGGGAVIYDEAGNECTQLDIKKCADWIELEDISDELRNISGENDIDMDFAKLIINQFRDSADNKKVLIKALERKYSEEELEEFFLNTVYLGDGVYGISSASKHFFGCEYENVPRTSFSNLRKIIVEYTTVKNYDSPDMEIYEDSMIYQENGYTDGVIKETAKKLMNTGMDELSAYNMIFLGKIHIYTYMNRDIQEKIEAAYADKSLFTSDKSDSDYFVQSAMVIMDKEGKIKAAASGNNNDKTFNRAVSSKYQIGSAIKPVSTYSLAIESGRINFSSMIENRQMLITDENGEERFWPSNSDNVYGGSFTVTRALQESKNTVAVEIGRMVGEENMYNFLKDELGYDLVYFENQNSDCQLSALSLGYLYNGITLDRLTSSYEMFANGGKFYASAMVRKAENASREEILTDDREGRQVISEQTAYIMNRLLYNNVYGEYGIADKAAIDGIEVSGKTGTVVNDYGESIYKMFVGITSDYIAGVQVGYDNRENLSLKLFNAPEKIFSQIMSQITHSGEKLCMPEGVVEKQYCEVTGMIATDKCKKTGTGYYTLDNIPEDCSVCQYNN